MNSMMALMSMTRSPRKRSRASLTAMGLALLLPFGSALAECLDQAVGERISAGRTLAGENLDRLLQRADQAMRVGYREQARDLLEIAAHAAGRQGDAHREAMSLGALGHAYLVDNRSLKSRLCIRQSLQAARETGDDALLSSAYLTLANYQATIGVDRQNAELNFSLAIEAAERASRRDLAARARLNVAQIDLRRAADEDFAIDDAVIGNLERAERDVRSLDDGRAKDDLLLAVGRRWSDVFAADTDQDPFAARAYQAIDAVLEGARRRDDKELEAAGLGELGLLYERAGRSADALDLYRQAETIIRFSETPNNAYPWSWRMAKLLAAGGDRQEAIGVYQRAVDMTKAIRRSTANVQGHRDFAPTVLDDTQTLLSEYLELLFDDRTDASDNEDLRAIRGLVEQQREVDVQTFFQDDCIADLRSRITAIDQRVEANTALIYPVRLQQEWVMLVQIGELLWSERLAASPDMLADRVRELRGALQIDQEQDRDQVRKIDPQTYLGPGRQLYRILIEPIRSRLREYGVDTLVIVPSGLVRSIPFAALHDGDNFLIRDYAVATVPGLSLLDPRSSEASSLRALIGGLTTEVEGFERLDYVPQEIERIRSSIPDGATLAGADFVAAGLQRTLDAAPYSVVHVASHAEIGASAADSFIVTHGGNRLGLDGLEDLLKSSNYREQPVQLLTLSACTTAVGVDQDRAALGLAGIAVKSGARSAIGTLWPVLDRSSAVLMGNFYEALTSGGDSINKAKALQRAQLALLDDEEFEHPVFWAPYLLIGSWN